MSEWIPVEERLPTEHQRCLAWAPVHAATPADGSDVWLSEYEIVSEEGKLYGLFVDGYTFVFPGAPIEGVTHWMPLPEGPK